MSMDEVDDIMNELGLQKEPKNTTSVDEVDALMAEIGVSVETGRGRARGVAGPGAARGISSGPGAKARGIAGPGRGAVGRGMPMATTTPDGRDISHKGPPCENCQEVIIGACVNALGKTYHPEHFVCENCNRPFANGQFVEHEGKPYCEFDYSQLFCPRCANCQQPIVDKCINAAGKQFHSQHFTCTGCGRNLAGQAYKVDGEDIFCSKCKESRKQKVAGPAEPCARCKLPITGEWVILHGQKMHAEHFRCDECSCEFKHGNCHEYEGRLYCTEDYNKLMKATCASCHKPIVGRSITALGRVWHPEHFVCTVCHEPFSGSNFFEHDNKPYCDLHYAQLFGDPCGKCNRPVVREAITFVDKVYHPDCFVCTGCDKILKKGDVNEWESKPMCMSCYGKLPKEVRKKVEKKREAEKKLADQREKEDKKKEKEQQKAK